MTKRTLHAGLVFLALVFVSDAIWMGTAYAADSAGAEGGHDFLSQFSIFVLMSVTNAVSSVIVVGALLAVSVEAANSIASSGNWLAKLLGFAALILASVNIFGGFLVTQRMLAMYRRKDR